MGNRGARTLDVPVDIRGNSRGDYWEDEPRCEGIAVTRWDGQRAPRCRGCDGERCLYAGHSDHCAATCPLRRPAAAVLDASARFDAWEPPPELYRMGARYYVPDVFTLRGRGVEAARLAGGDLAGEHAAGPATWRNAKAKIRRLVDFQHRRHLPVEFRRQDHRGQPGVPADDAISPRGSQLRPRALDRPDAAGIGTSTDARAEAALKTTGTVQPFEKEFFRKDDICSSRSVKGGDVAPVESYVLINQKCVTGAG